ESSTSRAAATKRVWKAHPTRTGDNGIRMLIQKILFPVDFSDRSRGATNFVEEFIGRFQAELTVLHVVPPFTYNDTMDKEADRRLQIESFLPADFAYFNVKRVLLHGDPALQIVD